MSTWKNTERKVAELFGGERIPITGRIKQTDTPDIDHPWLSIEVKHRKKLPEWILDAMRQAERTPNKLPIAVLHEKQMKYTDSLVIVRLKDFIDHFGT